MEVGDYGGTVELDSEEAVARFVAEQRYDGGNYILLLAPSGFPRLHVLLSENRANLLFQTDLDDPGFFSVSSDESTEGETTFHQSLHDGKKSDAVVMANDCVVSIDDAVRAAREFYRDPGERPRSVRWHEL